MFGLEGRETFRISEDGTHKSGNTLTVLLSKHHLQISTSYESGEIFHREQIRGSFVACCLGCRDPKLEENRKVKESVSFDCFDYELVLQEGTRRGLNEEFL